MSCVDAIVKGIKEGVTDAATTVVQKTFDLILSAISDQLHQSIAFLAKGLAGWILVPSTQVCNTTGPDWVSLCANGTNPAAQVRAWMLPLTVLIAVVGIIWQGITMTITRKGEPLLTVLKGLFSITIWGAVGIAGTQLAMRAGDAYAYWILQQAIFGNAADPTNAVGTAIANLSLPESGLALLLMIVLLIPFMIATGVQIILMIFRDGAVIILAGQLQLAAAGGFTRITSGWLGRVTGWMLALIAYKPAAASIYAVAFALMSSGGRNLVMGVAVMILAVVALPALMKFFTWTVAAADRSGSGVATGAAAAAAGLHAVAALRAAGGHSAAQQAQYLDTHGPGPMPPPSGAPPDLTPPLPPPPLPLPTAPTKAKTSPTGSPAAGGR
jgi:hypothetical protein